MSTELQLKLKLFTGLSDQTRLRILENLESGELCVHEIVEKTALTQSNISNHLACLKDCGLVINRRQGKHVYYSLSNLQISNLLKAAAELAVEIASDIDSCKYISTNHEKNI